MVNSQISFRSSLAYPEPLVAACSIVKLGRSSVVWAVALFAGSSEPTTNAPKSFTSSSGGCAKGLDENLLASRTAAAYGTMTHVYVDPGTGKSIDIPPEARTSLEKLVVR
jgi:acyl-CoA thioester hydrolase